MDPALQKEINEAIGAALAPLAKQIAGLEGSVGQVAEAGKKFSEIEKDLKILGDTVAGQKVITPDDVKGLIGAELTAAQKATAEKAATEKQRLEASATLKAEKDGFIAEKLKGIPAAYHSLLGDAKEKWGEMERSIRETFAADAKAAGLQVPNLGGSGGGAAPASEGTGTGGFLVMPGAVK